MATWLLRRLAAALAIVFAVVTLSFIAIHLAPGTPFLPGDERAVDPAVVAALRARFGLDQPLPVQFVRYLGALGHGDLGLSFSQRRPVAQALADAVPNTLLLAGTALAVDLLLGLTLGTYQASRARRRVDAAIRAATLTLYSLPVFWLALVLLLVFGERLHWLPVGGIRDPVLSDSAPFAAHLADRLRHLILPALTLGVVGAAGTARYQRAAMLEALNQEFVRAARAKGLSERRVVWLHALRNALLPAITMVGLALPFLLTGAVLVETVFAWPGMGKLTADAIAARDYPVVTATALLASVLVVTGSALADLLYMAADPRVRAPDA
ncbi:MAG TPA: ABC transporter permease [Gemmatimonadales bacterium]|nr:ABC transporter permease [Gemmatimonadales bacterium]